MTPINANTKIASLIKQNPDALEAIVSLSPKFTKLRNPLLRKVIAGRTSIAMASKIGGCSIDDFFSKLQPLGFDIDKVAVEIESYDNKPMPGFIKNLPPDKIIELDVRPIIETGKDPLTTIIQNVQNLKAGSVLKIINSFEPTPLILLLGRQGFESHTEVINYQLVNTYFHKKTDKPVLHETESKDHSRGWDEIADRFSGKIETIDVRELEMPLPMHAIMEALQKLQNDKALFVYHKRIPVFLLPELEEQRFNYRIREIREGEVHLMIYKN